MGKNKIQVDFQTGSFQTSTFISWIVDNIYHHLSWSMMSLTLKTLLWQFKLYLISYFFIRIVVSNTKLFQAIFIWNVFIVVYLQCRRKVRWDVPDKHCRLKRWLDALRPSWDFQIHLQGSFQTKNADFLELPLSEGGHHLVSVWRSGLWSQVWLLDLFRLEGGDKLFRISQTLFLFGESRRNGFQFFFI